VIDIHTHVLPGVDDGARDLEQALAMCRQAVADGTTTLIATPHVRHASYWNGEARELRTRYDVLRIALAQQEVPLDLRLGGEIAMNSDSVDELLAQRKPGRAQTLHTLAGSRWALLEFDFSGLGPDPLETVHEVLVAGYAPIVAHPERFRWLAGDERLQAALIGHGAAFQLTAMSITGEIGRFAQDAAQRMLERGWVRFVASDCHDVRLRPAGLARARAAVAKSWGAAAAQALFIDNPRAVIEDRLLS
jgi:protein-tyrosine phosphatase